MECCAFVCLECCLFVCLPVVLFVCLRGGALTCPQGGGGCRGARAPSAPRATASSARPSRCRPTRARRRRAEHTDGQADDGQGGRTRTRRAAGRTEPSTAMEVTWTHGLRHRTEQSQPTNPPVFIQCVLLRLILVTSEYTR